MMNGACVAPKISPSMLMEISRRKASARFFADLKVKICFEVWGGQRNRKKRQSGKCSEKHFFSETFFTEFFRKFFMCVFLRRERQKSLKNDIQRFQHKNRGLRKDSIKSAEEVVLQTQPIAFASSAKDLEKQIFQLAALHPIFPPT